MLSFAGGYRRDGDWWVSDDAGRVDSVRRSLRGVLEDDWLLDRGELRERFVAAGVGSHLSDADVAFLSGWRAIGDDWWVALGRMRLGTRQSVFFRLALRACRPTEMNELIGEGHAKVIVQNVLSV